MGLRVNSAKNPRILPSPVIRNSSLVISVLSIAIHKSQITNFFQPRPYPISHFLLATPCLHSFFVIFFAFQGDKIYILASYHAVIACRTGCKEQIICITHGGIMSGFHPVTPGAALLPIAFHARMTAVPGQAQQTGGTIAEIAGQFKRVAQTAASAGPAFIHGKSRRPQRRRAALPACFKAHKTLISTTGGIGHAVPHRRTAKRIGYSSITLLARDFMSEKESSADASVLNDVISALRQLSAEDRQRVVETVITFFDIKGLRPIGLTPAPAGPFFQPTVPRKDTSQVSFSTDLAVPPKEFIMEKQPRTDVERVACLAYYLTHYRETPKFRTLDLSKLNTEAAQRKFANPAWAVHNAVKQGYLIQAGKGNKQLSAAGEQSVRALPDHEEARRLLKHFLPRKRARRKANKKVE
jgi:hypothetical protein